MKRLRAILGLALILCIATATAHSEYYSKTKSAVHMKEKVTHLHFFLHDILSGKNPSAVMVAHPNRTYDNSPTPFGSLFAIDDPLRTGPEPTSEVIGNAQGLYLSSNQDINQFTIVLYADFAFTTGKFKGSSFGVFSRNPVVEPNREVAVVGGRGKFRLARGFAKVTTAYFNGTNGDAILDYKMKYLKPLNFYKEIFKDILMKKDSKHGRLLGLDVSEKYVSLAVSDWKNLTAVPLRALDRQENNMTSMAADIFQSLGTNAVQVIVLEMSKIKNMHLSPQAFKKMYNLRLLKFYYDPTWIIGDYLDYTDSLSQYHSKVHFGEGLSDLSDKLRSLIWLGYPSPTLPSNFNPNNLVELDLSRSTVESLWEDSMHAPKLKWLFLNGCTRLTKIPDLSESLLIEMIDIRYCSSLLDFPPLAQHVNNLHDLSENHFEHLPKSMKQLRVLGDLNLNRCNMLQSLTDLPSSLYLLSASDCEQLRSIPDASEFAEIIRNTYHSSNFIFTNCLNLEAAVGNMLALLTTYLNKESESYSLCYSGSEVPGWFIYRTEGSSIKCHQLFGGQLLGFAVCAVIAFEEYCYYEVYDNDDFGDQLNVLYKFISNNEVCNRGDIMVACKNETLIDSDHVALGFLPYSLLWKLQDDFTNCSFEFSLSEESPNCRVKYCGVCPIYANQNIGETSGRKSCTSNDHQEEEVEPHSKRLNP
ncbi:hypothetical protein LWI29_032594 [Acer saccharum]|uniref:Dirigent protein n=1 Tax=Acer saccharum TaxID=4024 RepID=A0AA39S1H0_ACESA|nr:hypothetical protein LWI29_032594 [Acer saccharum]